MRFLFWGATLLAVVPAQAAPVPVAPVPSAAPAASSERPGPVEIPPPGSDLAAPGAKINPAVFKLALEFLANGKTGKDLAEEVEERNQHFELISEEGMKYLVEIPPEILVPQLLSQAAPVEMAPALADPRVPLFLATFCSYFYDTEVTDEEPRP